ncbi:MAG: DeoR family transcriptional regulator [Bacillota bacterium]|nr:MAG: DeoR family transcriptional regulator [Bacillota bacterium]
MEKRITSSSQPLYITLAEQIKRGARELPAHTKLASIRTLAKENGVNTSTVVAAFNLLESQGMVYCKEGSGTYLAPSFKPQSPPQVELMPRGERIDFTSGTPSPEYFPVEDFQVAFNAVLERDRGHAFAYPEPQGYLPLRISITEYLKTHGMAVDPEQVYITSGAQQAIFLLAQTLIKAGDTALVESPTYPGALQALHSCGAKIAGVPLGYNGPKLKQLSHALRFSPKLMYTVPNFQNPTGICYSQESRTLLIGHARENDFYIIEDDHVSELYYTGSRPRTLWQDAPDRVLYVKSFSKVFMPGLRLGFVIVPPPLLAAIHKAKLTADLGSSGINQRALDHYLRQGKWNSHQEYLRKTYKDRAATLHEALSRHLHHETFFQPIRGGMNCWLALPRNVRATDLHRLALIHGIQTSPGEQFSLTNEHQHHLRLSIAAVFTQEIEKGAMILAKCLSDLLGI